MPHPAKIAFTLLSHVADEKDIGGRFERRPLQRSSNRQKGGYACCVVTDPRPIELVGFFARLQRGALRKNRIQMCADADERLSHPAVQQPQDISQIVHANIFQTEGGKSLPQPFTARSLSKRGRWDLSKLALPATELHFLIVEIAKSSMHAAHFRDASDLALGGSPGVVRNRWTGGHFLTNNYITRRPRE